MSPVEFANQDRGYWYKLRGRACETRIDPGAQQSGVRGQQAPNLIEICGDWGEFSDAVELSPLGVCRPLSSGVRGSGGSVQRTACVPPKPTNLTVAGVSDSEATLKWQASEGATDYAVRLDGVVVDDSIGDVTEYRFIGLAARTAHVLSVDAKNSVGSSASAELTLLVPPHGLSATTTRNSISLSWTLDGRATKAEARLGATGNVEDADARTSHTFDQSIRPSSSYTVYVRAANAQGSSAWASMSVATQGGCASQQPAKPESSRDQLVETETRWSDPVGGQTAEEQRERHQPQTRSVTWSSSGCRWVTGDWTDAGGAVWKRWTPTGVTRVAPAKPANSQTIVVRSETRWAEPVGGRTAGELRDLVERQSRSVSWDTTAGAWSTGTWGNVGPPSWTLWSATGVTRAAPAKPANSQTIVVRSETRWAEPVGGRTAEEQRDLVQRQSRSVSWDTADCAWITGSWGNVGSPAWTPWRPTGVTRVAPAKPSGNQSIVVRSETRWAEPVGGNTAEEQRDLVQRQSRRVSWDAADCAWITGSWGNVGSPAWTPWSSTGRIRTAPAKPAGTLVEEVSPRRTQLDWQLRGMTAHEVIRVRMQRRSRSVTWDETLCAWQTGQYGRATYFWSGWSDTGNTKPKPSDDVVRVTVQTTTQTRWVRIDDGVFCLLEEQSRTGVRYSYHRRPHVWSDSAHAWLDGRRNPRPYFTEPPGAFHWSSWTRTGRSQRCLQSPADGTASGQSGSAATAPAARLQAGSYHFVWGAHAFTFAVPEGATVILSARTLGSGIEAAVFSSSNGAELVVDPGSLPAHSASSGPTVTGVTDATLLAIAASIRQAAPQVAAQQAEAEQACAVAEGGSFRLDLDADPCIAVWGGGTATVSRSGSSLTLVLASSRSWLVVAATHGASEIPAVMLVDIASGGYLTIKAADGTELSRNLGTGGEVLGALFDAMLPQPGDDTS